MNRGAVMAGAGVTLALSLGTWAAWVKWHGLVLPPVPQEEMAFVQDSCEDYLKEPPEQPRMPIQVEWIAPPKSWRETVTRADAVLVGRRSPETPEEIAPQRPPCTWFTLYPFEVLEAVKGTVQAQRIQVAWMGRQNEGAEGFPGPEVGDVYLLFLRRQADRSRFHPMYGPYANVRISGGNIIALFDGKPLEGLHGRSAEKFIAELRGYVGRECEVSRQLRGQMSHGC